MPVFLKKLLLRAAQWLGREIRDDRTGELLGRALCLAGPWGIWTVGLPHGVAPVFLPEGTTKYTRHRIGFQRQEMPDYPSLHPPAKPVNPEKILWVILVHHVPAEVLKVKGYWESLGYREDQMLFVHAGEHAHYEGLDVRNKVFVEDLGIRTKHHPLEKQSYGGMFREVSAWMEGRDSEAVAVVEYDHIPLIRDWGARLCARLQEERADMLCHHLNRVDGTNASHYLYHLVDPGFREIWNSDSRREEKSVFFNAVMTGSFWKRAAFDAVAARKEAIPFYLELYLPSLAHHLGFRVRNHGEQDKFVQVIPMHDPFSPRWQSEGAWSLHQVKSLPPARGRQLSR